MIKSIYLIIVSFALIIFISPAAAQLPVKETISLAQQQFKKYILEYPDSTMHPATIDKNGSIERVKYHDWVSGFFSGNLWYVYLFTKNQQWKNYAQQWTATLQPEEYVTTTHDLGFILYTSFGNGYHITGNPQYKDILLQAARSLCTRFNPVVGSIRSWDGGPWHYPVIVDNLMNLQLLFWAAKTSGDSSFYRIAVSHINNDLKYRFRSDGSTYHVLDFDPVTGKLLARKTAQGYSDSSCWSRGQAWAIYGLTTAYRYTKDKIYLQYAIKAANYFIREINKIPDHIPYWDFNAPDIPNAPKDASAAAIASSGLLELSRFSNSYQKKYYHEAIMMLKSLCSPAYLAASGTNDDFLLKHCTGNKPGHSEIDVPLVYADYYFLQAIWRYQHYADKQFFPDKY